MDKLKEVAIACKLNQSQTTIFIKYMEARFDDPCIFSRAYMTEWAKRFKNETEYEYSDLQGRKLLKLISPVFYWYKGAK